MSDITLEQIKERLVPVLQQIGLVYTLDTKGKERERWDEMHSILSPLFLDISVAIDHQEESKPVRDTQFRGFAKLLIRDLDAVSTTTYASLDKAKEAYDLAIARAAYRLVEHTIVELSCQGAIDFSDPDFDKYEYAASEMVEIIPDMAEWPTEDK